MKRDRRTPLVLVLALAACSPATTSSAPAAAPPSAAPAPPSGGPVFVEDDYPRALAEARAQGKPLFVDAWATWCHTCLSMRSYVFPDPALRPLAGDFVWLSLDTEKPESAAFLARYPMQVWPTLWVIDPKTEAPALKWLGSATARELVDLLADTKSGLATGQTGGEAAAALLRGQQASAAGKREDAAKEYEAALLAAPPRWNKRAATVEALVARLDELKRDAECVDVAKQEMPKLPGGTSLANVGLSGLECAERSPDGSAAKKEAPVFLRAIEQIALDESVPILADDRSGLFESAIDFRTDAGDKSGARAMAARWADFLERQARAATTPAGRAVFDAHRLLAYLALGDPSRAVPMLSASEKDFPKDYNPPARLAKAYLELKRYDDGLAAIDRAMAVGYGPRKMRFYLLKADLLVAKGDKAGATAVLHEAASYAATLPAAEKPKRDLAEVEKRLAAP